MTSVSTQATSADPGSRRAFARPSELAAPRHRRRHAWAGPVGWALVALAATATLASAALGRVSVFGAVVVVLLLAGSQPLLRRFSANDHGVDLESLLRVGLGLKFLAVLPRFALRQDAIDYHAVGTVLADSFRSLDFLVETGRPIPGTGSVRYATGLVHVLTFSDEFATFAIFAMLGFIGLALFIRAFVDGLPDVDPGRYAVLMVCWPSLAYWPASTGKEALMTFGLGLAAFGLARLLRGGWMAMIPLAAGLAVSALVRPHVALIVVTAGVGAFIMHSRRGAAGGVVTRLIVIGGLVGVGTLLSDAVERLFNVQDLNVTSVSAALDLANHRSAQGGSSFVAARIDSVADVPWGVVTVLLRPLPHEAASAPGLVAAFEGLVLAALLLGAIPRLMAATRTLRREAYVAYAVGFVAVFVFLFSALGNFGILTRQRTMVTPLLLVLVSLPTAYERVRSRRVGRST
ncbi:MAG: hypothetical protein AAGA90_12515 [Actinomycetota bacterium]